MGIFGLSLQLFYKSKIVSKCENVLNRYIWRFKSLYHHLQFRDRKWLAPHWGYQFISVTVHGLWIHGPQGQEGTLTGQSALSPVKPCACSTAWVPPDKAVLSHRTDVPLNHSWEPGLQSPCWRTHSSSPRLSLGALSPGCIRISYSVSSTILWAPLG